jgi:hypothetical protein
MLNTSGVVTLTLTPPVGLYMITANYGGSPADLPSESAPPVTVTASLAPTATVLTASPNPAPFGASVNFSATVSSSAGTPSGTVSFYDGTALIGTATLASGAAAYSTSTLSVGSHSITAQYGATAAFGASTSIAVIEVISPADFTIAATPASLTLYTGQAASYTVAITPIGDFALPVTLTCSQLPANTTCAFSPANITGGSGSSTLTVQTSAPHEAANTSIFPAGYRVPALAGLFLFFLRKRGRYARGGWPMAFAILALLTAGAVLNGCSAPSTLTGGTPVGAETITVAGSATNGSQTLTHETTVILNVNSLF